MTGLTPHLAQTLVDDRLRGAEQARVVHNAVVRGGVIRRRRRGGLRDADTREVVAAAAGGDERAWALLHERYGARVRTVVRFHRLPPEDVDDVVQTTWLRLIESIGGMRNANAVGAWLETTARRECLALLRRRKRERPAENGLLTEQPCEPVAERRLVAGEERAALASGLARLPQRQRRLLVAMLAEPTPSYGEIAAALKMPIGSIGPTRARTLARLRQDPVLAGTVGENVDPEPQAG
jgi:RNA polymerase sigma factor (sigma-70 family)